MKGHLLGAGFLILLWIGPSFVLASGQSDGSVEGGAPGHVVRPCSKEDPPPCVTAPRLVSNPAPQYSEQARKAKLEGTCVLGLIVEPNGSTSHIRIVKSLGMGLDEKAIEAVKTWRFEPGKKFEPGSTDGKPVPVQIAVEVSFHL